MPIFDAAKLITFSGEFLVTLYMFTLCRWCHHFPVFTLTERIFNYSANITLVQHNVT